MFTIDATSPVSMIYSPENDGYYNQLNAISGFASDFMNGTGLNKVEITIKRLSDNFYWNGTNWTSQKHWLDTLGTKTWSYNTSNLQWVSDIYYNIRSRATDNADNIEISSPGITFMYDDKPPEISIIINKDNKYTNSTAVLLSLKAIDTGSGVWQMGFSNYGVTWTDWELYNITKQFNLTKGNGQQIVYFKVRDRANNSAITKDSIILDTTPPYSLSILINNGDSYTKSTNVILKLNARDALSGVFVISFSSDGENWSFWEEFSITKNYTLEPGGGEKTIYYRVMDRVGNIAEPISSTIFLNVTSTTEEKQTPEKSSTKTDYWFIFIIILIIIIVLVIVISMGKRKKRKKTDMAKKEAITVKPSSTPAPDTIPHELGSSPAQKPAQKTIITGTAIDSATTQQQLLADSVSEPQSGAQTQIGQPPALAQIPQVQPTPQLPPAETQVQEQPPTPDETKPQGELVKPEVDGNRATEEEEKEPDQGEPQLAVEPSPTISQTPIGNDE